MWDRVVGKEKDMKSVEEIEKQLMFFFEEREKRRVLLIDYSCGGICGENAKKTPLMLQCMKDDINKCEGVIEALKWVIKQPCPLCGATPEKGIEI